MDTFSTVIPMSFSFRYGKGTTVRYCIFCRLNLIIENDAVRGPSSLEHQIECSFHYVLFCRIRYVKIGCAIHFESAVHYTNYSSVAKKDLSMIR
jgi:hypothetical protein